MQFSRPEHCSGQPFLSPGDLPDPGIEPRSPALQAGSSLAEPPGKPLLAPRVVFGGRTLRPVLTAACSGVRPWVSRSLLMVPCAALGPSAGAVCPLLPPPRAISCCHGDTRGTVVPFGGSWMSPGRWLQCVGRCGFVSACPCTSVFAPGRPGSASRPLAIRVCCVTPSLRACGQGSVVCVHC